MTERLRRTVRSFLRRELPPTPSEAAELLQGWFGRYDPEPDLLEQEIARHFADRLPQGGGALGSTGRARGMGGV